MRHRTVLIPAVVTSALVAVFLVAPASAAPTVTNPGFESNGASQTPAAWSESGTVAASKTEAGGRTGGFRLTHWASSAYSVETFQTLTGLTPGTYTFAAWTRSGGGQSTVNLRMRNCGGSTVTAAIPASSSWTQIRVTTSVTSSNCTLGIFSTANAGNWINVDDVTFTSSGTPGPGLQIRGGDVSSLKKNEDRGALYFTASGAQGDALTILRNSGMNYGRLKVWVNPADGYNNKARVLQMATRIKALGMGLLVDFHYSDRWADPGQQNKPAAWASMSLAQLNTAVYNHTFDVLSSLQAQGTTADIVQVGNEINSGMLWPTGNTSGGWGNLAQLLKSGINAVKAVNPSTRVMLHLGNGNDNGLYRWWFDNAVANGVQFDIIGASYYCYWHGTLSQLQNNLNDMAARYNKDIIVAETAYGFTLSQDDSEPNIFNSSLQSQCGYPASSSGQTTAFQNVINVVRSIPNGRGIGYFYWEPAWTAQAGGGWDPTNPNSGNGWENQALFDYSSRALPAISLFGSG